MNIISFFHLFVCDLEQYCTFRNITYHISTCEGSILCYETCIIETETVKVSFDKKIEVILIFMKVSVILFDVMISQLVFGTT